MVNDTAAPSEASVRRDAREARAAAGRSLGWLDRRRGPVSLQQALDNALRAETIANGLVCDLKWLIEHADD